MGAADGGRRQARRLPTTLMLRQRQWSQHSHAVLAVAAAVGWALYLWERVARRRRHAVAEAPVPADQPVAAQQPAIDDQREEWRSTFQLRLNSLREEVQAAEPSPSPQLEQEEEQLRDLAAQLEALAAELNKADAGVLQSARAARGAASTPGLSRSISRTPATARLAVAQFGAAPTSEQGSPGSAHGTGTGPSMEAFRQRLLPLQLRPTSAARQPPPSPPLHACLVATGSPQRSGCTYLLDAELGEGSSPPRQQQAAEPAWSPKLTVACLAACSPVAAGRERHPGTASAAGSPATDGTPAALRRTLRQSAAGSATGKATPVYCRDDSSRQQQEQQPQPQEQPTPLASQIETAGSKRPQSALRRKLPRPPTPTGSVSGDFAIAAYKAAEGGTASMGSTPRGAWPQGPSPSGPDSSRIPKPHCGWSPAGTPRPSSGSATPAGRMTSPRQVLAQA